MQKFRATFFAFSLLVATAAFAQNSGSSTVKSPSAGSTNAVGAAPVGHRQPKAGDVPPEKDAADLSAEDKALDRKIKSICRGC